GRMTGIAGDAVRCMRRMEELGLLAAGGVALLATFGVLLRITSEREDKLCGCQDLRVIALRCANRIDVRPAWAMAGLASHNGILGAVQGSVLRLSELLYLDLMTGRAGVGARVGSAGGGSGFQSNRGWLRRRWPSLSCCRAAPD